MDANGTRFKLLLGRGDWGACLDAPSDPGAAEVAPPVTLATTWSSTALRSAGTTWDEDRSELVLARSVWQFKATEGTRVVDRSARRGAAMDRYGNWYFIDGAGTGVLATSSGSGATTPFWPAPDTSGGSSSGTQTFGPVGTPPAVAPRQLRGVAVTDDHYLLVGTLEPGGLLVFDLRSGGPPWHAAWPTAVGFAPLDMAPRRDGGAFVLDSPSNGPRRVWRLDRHLMVEPLGQAAPPTSERSPFEPLEGSGGVDPRPVVGWAPGAITANDARSLDGDPVAIGIATAERVVVLDLRGGSASSAIRLFDADMEELPGSPRELGGLERRLVAHAMAVVPRQDEPPRDGGSPVLADIYLADTQGDQAFRFLLTDGSTPLELVPDYHPMRLFGGRGLVATPFGVWYDCVDRWVPIVAQRRPQYADGGGLETPVLDSQVPACTWHRLMLDACIPPETAVRVWSAASDDPAALEQPEWTMEPRPYRRGDGSERPFSTAAQPPYGTYELLFQAARGQYLRVRIELIGNRRESPRLRAMRAYYPRFSYLEQYLPHAYREDRDSAQFLDGFLANFEGFYTSIEDRIAAAEVLVDARSAPREGLDWLASWFDVVMDRGWDEERRRLFIRHAVELFRLRGTARGIRIALGLALLECPDDRLFAPDADVEPGGIRIIERYQTKRAPATLFGDPTAATVPRETADMRRWTPEQGGAALHRRYGAYLAGLVGARWLRVPARREARYPIVAPSDDRRAAWVAFSDRVLGVVPSAGSADVDRWRRFLAHRYVSAGALNAAHRRLGTNAVASFDQVDLPATLPPDGSALADWFAFESLVLRSVRAAHRFSVLLPVPVGRVTQGRVVRAADARDRQAEQDRMARLVALEKPAHTVFDVRSYWLGFLLGEARLGRDTLLDLGSRSPDLRPPAVLGSLQLGESVLISAMADVPDRPAVFSGSVDPATRRVARRTDG